MTPLTDALRRLALHQDLPECAQALTNLLTEAITKEMS